MRLKATLSEPFELYGVIYTPYFLMDEKQSDAVLSIRNHEAIRPWMCTSHLISANEHRSFIEGLKEDKKRAYWLAEEKSECIGTMNLNPINYIHDYAYLGIFSNPDSSVHQKGKKLMNGLLHVTFERLRFHALKLEVMEGNEHAIAFYEKMGFRREGLLRDFVKKNGTYQNALVMGILKDEWTYAI